MIEKMYHTPRELPRKPPDGVYVIVDVWNFSMTLTTLLDNGAKFVQVAGNPTAARELKDEYPDAVVGSEPGPDGEIPEGFDFCNSPFDARQVDVEGRPVGMYTDNGATTVSRLQESETKLYAGSTLNARALGKHLRDNEDGVRIISAGYHGQRAVEDTIGACLIHRYIHTDEIADVEDTVFHDALRNCEAGRVSMDGSRRTRNDYTLAHDFNISTLIPRYGEEGFIDATDEATVDHIAEETRTGGVSDTPSS